jgi:hypothetical protein
MNSRVRVVGIANQVLIGVVMVLAVSTARASDGATDTNPAVQQPSTPPAKPAAAPANAPVEEIESIDVVETTAPAAGKVSKFDSAAWTDRRAFPQIERTVNLLGATPVRAGAGQIIINHRAQEPFSKNTFRDFFGLDAGGLKIGLGLRYSPIEDLDAGVYRLNGTTEVFDTYEFDARYRFLRQDAHWCNVAARAGLTWYYVRTHPMRSRFSGS